MATKKTAMPKRPRPLPKRFDAVPAAPAGKLYMVVGQNTWGKGDTLLAAVKQAQAAGFNPRKDRAIVFAIDPLVWIDQAGYTCIPPKNAIAGSEKRTPSGGLVWECDGDPVRGESPIELAKIT